MATVREIIEKYLRENGFDGIYNSDLECGCKLDDLGPCEGCVVDCSPGHVIYCGCKDPNWHIGGGPPAVMPAGWILVDGVARNKEHPDTFEIPSMDDGGPLVGDYVKILFETPDGSGVAGSRCNGERMWVEVDSVDYFEDCECVIYHGRLRSEPVLFHGSVKYGDTIRFTQENVIGIERKEVGS